MNYILKLLAHNIPFENCLVAKGRYHLKTI